MINEKVNFGILGAGWISNKFADACKRVKTANLIAVAARSSDKAEAFANRHGIGKWYGSYQELVNDPDIHAVYVGIINSGHIELIEMAAAAGKAILCEKPALMDYEHVKRFKKAMSESNVLFMEGVWSIHLPAMKHAKSWIENNRIGKLCMTDVTFCFEGDPVEKPRLFGKELYGGGLVDVGVYCIALTILMIGRTPLKVQASEYISEEFEVDEYGTALLTFPENIIGTINYGVNLQRNQKSYLFGTQGHIELTKFWDCQKVELFNKENELIETYINEHENGFIYEVEHFCGLYLEGKKESDVNTIATSLEYVNIYEQIRTYR